MQKYTFWSLCSLKMRLGSQQQAHRLISLICEPLHSLLTKVFPEQHHHGVASLCFGPYAQEHLHWFLKRVNIRIVLKLEISPATLRISDWLIRLRTMDTSIGVMWMNPNKRNGLFQHYPLNASRPLKSV